MASPRTIRLNPCDYLYYVHHQLMESRSHGGNVSFLALDADGRAEPECVQSALAAAMAAHPVTLSRLIVPRLDGRPHWRLPRSTEDAAITGAKEAYVYDDLRSVADWDGRLDRFCRTRNVLHWDVRAGKSQLRLEHYDLPDDRSRFIFRFAHTTMDAEGTQWFASEMQRLGGTPRDEGVAPAPMPDAIAPDHRPADIARGMPLLTRFKLVREALHKDAATKGLKTTPLLKAATQAEVRQGYVIKTWEPVELRQMRANAKRWAPEGPAHHARYLAMCVFRALDRIYAEEGVDSDAFALPFPASVTGLAVEEGMSLPRPVPGNYLVSPTLIVQRAVVADRQALGREVLRQIGDYMRNRVHIGQWVLLGLLARMRFSWYKAFLRLPLGIEDLSSGFSYFGTISLRLRDFCGARITNIWGCAPMGIPPGWNPIFSKFDRKLNLSLSWTRPHVPDSLARRFGDLIEQEIFSAD